MSKICKVLVVEDDHDIRDLLGEVFEMEGYHFRMAADGDEMRRILDSDDGVDVAILDVGLPGTASGLHLAEEVAARGVGVIMVSGYPDHFAALQSSGYRSLRKPFKLTLLLEVIDETLKATQRRCELANDRTGTAG